MLTAALIVHSVFISMAND